MSSAAGAAAIAAAFLILHDTVGSGPTFEKGQIVPKEELAFLGVERLLEAGAIAPYDPTPPPAPEPTETERLQAAWAEAERRGAEALDDAEKAEARVKALEADLTGVNRDRERLEAELKAEQEAHQATRAELGASLEEYAGHNRKLEAELAELKTPTPTEEPAESKPADKPAKKGG